MFYISVALSIFLAIFLPFYILTPEERKDTKAVVETASIGFLSGLMWFIVAPLIVVMVFFKR